MRTSLCIFYYTYKKKEEKKRPSSIRVGIGSMLIPGDPGYNTGFNII